MNNFTDCSLKFVLTDEQYSDLEQALTERVNDFLDDLSDIIKTTALAIREQCEAQKKVADRYETDMARREEVMNNISAQELALLKQILAAVSTGKDLPDTCIPMPGQTRLDDFGRDGQ